MEVGEVFKYIMKKIPEIKKDLTLQINCHSVVQET